MQWRFKDDAEPQVFNDFWYDLTCGGYIKPELLLADEAQVAELRQAVALVESFLSAAETAELLETM